MMEKYYITRVKHEEALPFVYEYMAKAHIPFPLEWAAKWKNYITWYGAQTKEEIKGVMGLLMCYSMPDELCGVGLYGNAHSVKVLMDYFTTFEHRHKFGYVEISNDPWLKALGRRGWSISPIIELTEVGNKVRLAEYVGV